MFLFNVSASECVFKTEGTYEYDLLRIRVLTDRYVDVL